MQQAERELQEALELRAGGEELLRRDGESLDVERQARARPPGGARRRAPRARSRRAARSRTSASPWSVSSTTPHHLGAEHVEHFGEPLPEIPGELPPNLAEMEVDLARLKEQIEAIGPVNVLAADEYSGEEERHKFLSVQRADVAASVDSLASDHQGDQPDFERALQGGLRPGERPVLEDLRRSLPRRRSARCVCSTRRT